MKQVVVRVAAALGVILALYGIIKGFEYVMGEGASHRAEARAREAQPWLALEGKPCKVLAKSTFEDINGQENHMVDLDCTPVQVRMSERRYNSLIVGRTYVASIDRDPEYGDSYLVLGAPR